VRLYTVAIGDNGGRVVAITGLDLDFGQINETATVWGRRRRRHMVQTTIDSCVVTMT